MSGGRSGVYSSSGPPNPRAPSTRIGGGCNLHRMLSLRAHALICVGLLAALIAVAAGGNVLAASG